MFFKQYATAELLLLADSWVKSGGKPQAGKDRCCLTLQPSHHIYECRIGWVQQWYCSSCYDAAFARFSTYIQGLLFTCLLACVPTFLNAVCLSDCLSVYRPRTQKWKEDEAIGVSRCQRPPYVIPGHQQFCYTLTRQPAGMYVAARSKGRRVSLVDLYIYTT